MGPNHRSFICGGDRGPVQWRYGEDHAANRIPGGSDRLSGGIRPSHPGSPGAGAERGAVHRPVHRHGRGHPGPKGPALSHPGRGGGLGAAAEGGAPAHPPRLLAQRAGVAVLSITQRVEKQKEA